ncbi:hypothetical protein [Rossellomorea aquimaris]|uniref:hypothetical protein n=1 Tax=Rossellomorea aquimaris TaxID=189382 RepID=UPI001CFE75A0|nr:hypothetical protein [Rossellomorea aquimaris]
MKKRAFISKNSLIQPYNYEGNNGIWEAHFLDNFKNKYIIEIIPKPFSDKTEWVRVSIEHPVYRSELFLGKTIKSASTFLYEFVHDNNKLREYFKFGRDEYKKWLKHIKQTSLSTDELDSLFEIMKSKAGETDFIADIYALLMDEINNKKESLKSRQ